MNDYFKCFLSENISADGTATANRVSEEQLNERRGGV
jgi:hypothetical protein